MNILITNDDGIEAANLLALAKAAVECADVKVVAPQREQSGVGHSFSYYRSLHFAPVNYFPCEAFWVDGTPADCMKFALKHIYKDFKFDLVISGVNNGDNAGVASFYSGTVGAAREAALWGIPAIAVSLQSQSDEALDYALKWVQQILRDKSFAGMPNQTLWNFNVPPCSSENPCRGVKVSTTSTSMFNDYYVEAEKSKDYSGEDSIYLLNSDAKVASMQSEESSSLKAYNLLGSKITDLAQGTDDWWLAQGYASLSPQSVNLTDETEYKRLISMNNLFVFLFAIFTSFFISCEKQNSSIKSLAACPEAPPVYENADGEFDPIAVPSEAVPCGEVALWGSASPFSLNMWQDYNSFSVSIMSMLFEPLAELHSTENRPVGILASTWEISDDGMVYTFKMDSRAKWSDGAPVSAYDIQFYYDVIMDPKNLTPIFKVGLSRLERPEIIDSLNFIVRAKDPHWANFWEAAGMVAFPKHIWEGTDFNSVRFEFPVVSGPYAIKQMKIDRSLELVRRADWWGRQKNYNAGKYNFEKIIYRFMEDRNKALEALKKGDFDAYPIYTSSIWMKQTDFEAVSKGYVLKNRVFNEEPIGFQGFALNLRRDKFKDVRVRKALSLLLDRELMSEKFMFNQYFLLNTYYPSLWAEHKNPTAALYLYAPDSARKLLEEAGYAVNAQGKLTDKDGKPFELTFLNYAEDIRHTTKFQEDLKAVGIESNIETVSLSTFRQRIDDADFDLCWLAWGASRLSDPEASWHSKTANDKGTNNTSGLQDSVIDSLIELQKTEQNLDARNEILRSLDTRLTEVMPYILLWQSGNLKILHWNRFGYPKSLYGKYNREEAIPIYWWYSAEKAQKLQNAQKKGEILQIPEIDVNY